MSRKPFTGGPLNRLNGQAGISAPENSVSASWLVRVHNPKSAAELEALISSHMTGVCTCGVVSKGTVRDFGKTLFNAQLKYWGKRRFSLKECVQWEYDLFVLQMLKGTRMEDLCRTKLRKLLPKRFTIRDTSALADEDLRVDLEVFLDGQVVAGIQVKPASYKNTQPGVRAFNANANKKYEAPVLYITYDYETEEFSDLKAAAEKILNLADIQ